MKIDDTSFLSRPQSNCRLIMRSVWSTSACSPLCLHGSAMPTQGCLRDLSTRPRSRLIEKPASDWRLVAFTAALLFILGNSVQSDLKLTQGKNMPSGSTVQSGIVTYMKASCVCFFYTFFCDQCVVSAFSMLHATTMGRKSTCLWARDSPGNSPGRHAPQSGTGSSCESHTPCPHLSPPQTLHGARRYISVMPL